MSVGFSISVNDSPLGKLKGELKAASKEVATLQKEIDKARKDGKQVSDDAIKKLGAAEARQRNLKSSLESDGARLSYEDKFNAQSASNAQGFNIRGMLGNKVEGALGKMAQRPGALNTVLNNGYVNQITGGAGSAAANGAGSVSGAFGSAVAAYAGPLAAMAAVAKGFQEGMSIFHNYNDDLRKSREDFAVKMADSSQSASTRRDLDALIMKREEYEKDKLGRAASGVLGYIPGVSAAAALRARSAGVDDYSMMNREAAQAARDSGFALDSKRGLRIGKDRDYAETYGSEEVGFIMQNTWGKVKDLWGSNADAQAATAKAKESFERFAKFANSGDDMAKNGDFAGATAAYKAAAEEQEMKANWRDPMTVWAGNQDSMKAAKLHAINQNPLPPLRRGQ